MSFRRMAIAAALVLGWAGPPGCGPVDLSRPPSLRFGEEACAECRMIINDDRFAAAIVAATGDTSRFDDIGCLIRFASEQPVRGESAYWVRSLDGGGWLDARRATYVRGPQIVSPMAYGFGARPAAPTGGAEGPNALRFDDLPALLDRASRSQAGAQQTSP